MTEGYIELPITVDPDVLAQQAFDALAAALPGYVAHPGNLDVWLVEVLSRMNAESAYVASRMPREAFRDLGGIAGVPVKDGAPATALTTWTMLDTAGYTVPAGTVVAYPVTGDVLVPFTVQTAFTVPPGSSSATGVVIEAAEVGVAGNGLPAQPLVLVDSLAFVVSVASTTISSAGVDPETISAFLDRLSEEFTLLTPRPILPADFAVLARRVEGVHRAVALDGLSPGRVVTDGATTLDSTTVTSATGAFTAIDVGRTITGSGIPAGATVTAVGSSTSITISAAATATAAAVTLTFGSLSNRERATSVAVVDSTGNALTATIKATVAADLDARRETNFLVYVIDPTYTAVAVDFAGKAEMGADPAAVTAAAQEAVKDYLDPGRWAGGDLQPPLWRNETVVRYLEVSHVLTSVPGLDYLTTLTVNGGTADVTLTGPAALPASTTAGSPTTVTGSVTAP